MTTKDDYSELEKCDNSCTQSKVDDAPKKVVNLDGGWGWIIVFASFICNMSIDGIAYSAGLIVAPVKDEFNSMESAVMTITSIQQCVQFLFSPLISILINRYGFRLVSMAGSLVVGLGLGTSFYANGVQYLCVTYGFITGFGFSMIYLPSILIVGYYFDHWRALATGIAVCGSSVGVFVAAPLTVYMVDNFGWRLATVSQIFFAVISFIVTFLFYRQPPKDSKDSNIAKNLKIANEYNEKLAKETNTFKLEPHGVFATNKEIKIAHNTFSDDITVPFLINGNDVKNNSNVKKKIGKLVKLESHKSLTMEIRKSFMRSYLELFLSPVFVLLALNGLLYMSGITTPYNYTVKRARLVGGMDNTVWLLPAIGISNTIGRVICGYISSIEDISALWVNNISIILSGLVLILSGLSYDLFYQLGYCITLGIVYAAFPVLRSVLAAQFLGLERLTDSLGLLLFFDSIGALIGAPIAGGLVDMTGDFNAPFYLAGGCLILSALLLLPLNVVSKWEQNKINPKRES